MNICHFLKLSIFLCAPLLRYATGRSTAALRYHFMISLAFYILTIFIRLSHASWNEYNLLQDIREDYHYFERPVENNSQPLMLTVRLYLNQIIDVEEKTKQMKVLAWLQYNWTDYKLKWDPDRYGGIKDIRLSTASDSFHIWRPDVLLFNSVSKSFESTFQSRLKIKYTGEVIQNPPGILSFSCNIDITWFPFDTQTCFLKFGTWTHTGDLVDLDMDLTNLKENNEEVVYDRDEDDPQNYFVDKAIDTTQYVENGEWYLINTPGQRKVSLFDGKLYHELFYYITIERRTLAYGINLIIPSIVMSTATVLGFTLPPDAFEKITLQTTIILSVTWLLQRLQGMTPLSSDAIPILTTFCLLSLLVVCTSTAYTIIVMNLQHRKPETHTMGPFMRHVLLELLPRLVMLKRPRQTVYTRRFTSQSSDTVLPLKRVGIKDDELSVMSLPCKAMCRQSSAESYEKSAESETDRITRAIKQSLSDACDDLHLINEHFSAITRRYDEHYEVQQVLSDWRFAAMAVDRLCLFLFTVFVAVSAFIIVLPHTLKYLWKNSE